MRGVSRSWLLVLAAAMLAGGCQSQLSRVRADNARLTRQVAELRADKRKQAREQRDLENEVMLLRDRRETVALEAGRIGEPSLPVEVLGPDPAYAVASAATFGGDAWDIAEDGTRVVGVTEDGTEIVYAGDAAAGRVGTWSGEIGESLGDLAPDELGVPGDDGDDDLDAPPPAPPPRKAAPARAAKVDPASAYRDAVDALHAGRHAESIDALRAFLRQFPRHDYADNAQYWLGEAFYDQREYAQAAVEFRATVENHPRGNKVPDALLKLAYSYLALGQTEVGRATLEEVVRVYPTSEPAKLATKRLETIAP
ncbi:MAG: tol-pal system protein YbgF [Kofleriaceae bacterium]